MNNEEKTFNVNSTGGEYNHRLTIEEMPSHNHVYKAYKMYVTSGSTMELGVDPSANVNSGTEQTGGSQSHNNLQPYIVTYMWKRTA